MKKGFTLVELSIVLVIIGLLIGGILVAQSMISTSRITSQISQIQQFDAGVMNFKTKYKLLPGDRPGTCAACASPSDSNGNGDGFLAQSDGGNVNYQGEISNFWYDLFPDQYTTICSALPNVGCSAVTNGATKNVPLSKMGKNGSFFVASSVGNGTWACGTANATPACESGNYYVVVNSTQLQTANSGTYSFNVTESGNGATTPVDLLALDKKMDDGLANSGTVLAGGFGFGGGGNGGLNAISWYQCTTSGGGGAPTGPTYDLTHSANECTPLIRIGGVAGDPQ